MDFDSSDFMLDSIEVARAGTSISDSFLVVLSLLKFIKEEKNSGDVKRLFSSFFYELELKFKLSDLWLELKLEL